MSAFSRSSSSRASIKLTAGLKISPLPEKHQKRPELIMPKASDYRSVAIAYQHPIQLEKVEQAKVLKSDRILALTSNHAKARSKLYAPSFGVAESSSKYLEIHQNLCVTLSTYSPYNCT